MPKEPFLDARKKAAFLACNDNDSVINRLERVVSTVKK
jgi:hypothetical protein